MALKQLTEQITRSENAACGKAPKTLFQEKGL